MRIYSKICIAALTGTILLSSCNSDDELKKENQMNTPTNEHHGINIHFMDTTVNPKDDFYNFVNGTWMRETEIPEDRKSWGSFYILRKNTDDTVLAILNNAINNNKFDRQSDQAKAIILFNSILDTNARNEAGITPLMPVLEKINSVSDLAELQQIISENPVQIANPFFSISASPKPEESSINGVKLYPGGLGLPDRDFYTKQDDEAKKIREQYKNHVARMLVFFGENEQLAIEKAETILNIETKLSETKLTKEERRDARIQNNPRSINEISKLTSAIDWNKWIDNLPVKKEIDTIIVTQLKYMKSLQNVLTTTPISEIKTLVKWLTIKSASSKLTTELEKVNWEFYSKTLDGTPQQRPADERALAIVNSSVGEALGKIYVEQQFPKEAKETAQTMVKEILEVYKERIKNLDWMSEPTKEKAIEKVNALTVKIGYPDVWKDYSDMGITAENSYYENNLAVAEWKYKFNLSKINEPVDRNEWFMNPQTVNAYFSPANNEIVFPAAILQAPFFDYKADAAVNFGGIGAVIGHEISHAFDDSGSRFDANGNLKNWWTDEDLKKFEERTKKLADFYSSVKVEDDLYLNGAFTLGENTADLGGILAAYHGLKRYYKTHEKPGKIDGFTQEQRLFISWATIWRNKTRPEALRNQIKTDPHAPGLYRAYLPLQNVDEFYEAFDIKEDDGLYIAPEERIRIW